MSNSNYSASLLRSKKEFATLQLTKVGSRIFKNLMPCVEGIIRRLGQAQLNQRLTEVSHHDQTPVDALFEGVYVELRRMAREYLRDERPDHTLQATALVHEAYLRLTGGKQIAWENRAQFFSIASQVMRHILVDHARKHSAEKRGHGASKLSLDHAVDLAAARDINLVVLDDALTRLAGLDTEQSRIVELRFFGGLTIPEIAELLGISEMTVSRKWKTARLWLHDQMIRNDPHER